MRLYAYLLFFLLLLPKTNLVFAADRQEAFVQEVLSGDTVRLRGGKTLRYIGLEAPPLQHIIPLIRTYGEASKKFNEGLVLNKTIQIEWGPRLRDSRNNLLGYVYLPDGTFVNLEILKAGQGKPRITSPNLAFADQLKQVSLAAQRNRIGLWKEEPKNPYIKSAYIGEKNSKIYYLPNSPELDRIPQSYLVSFGSRVEATAAGYRACSNCKETISYNNEADSLY